jgi:hypothetical protein
MAVGAMTKLYRRLGGWYPFAFIAVELQTALVIVAGTLALFTFYFEGDWGEYAAVLAIALVLTEAAIVATLVRIRPLLHPLRRWIDGERDQESTDRAWSAAVTLPLHLVKRDLPMPVLITVVPTCVAGIVILELSWLTIIPLLLGAAIAMGYAAMLH